MPRSGSTLLQNLLAQCPRHHCTPTNDGLLDLLCTVRDVWMQRPTFIAQGLKQIEPRVVASMHGMVEGFYARELSLGKHVFDKSRGHLSKIELLEAVLGRKIKVIVPIRDIRDVVASFEKLYRKSFVTDHPLSGNDVYRTLTVRGRAERLCSIDHTIGYVVNCLQDAFERGLQDRLVIVPYHELTHRPIETVKRVCEECGVESFTCDPNNVVQMVKEDDTVYGMGLHEVRKVVEPDIGESWVGVLPDDLSEHLDRQFSFIQQLAQRRYLPRL